jgi:hypothetical protein
VLANGFPTETGAIAGVLTTSCRDDQAGGRQADERGASGAAGPEGKECADVRVMRRASGKCSTDPSITKSIRFRGEDGILGGQRFNNGSEIVRPSTTMGDDE